MHHQPQATAHRMSRLVNTLADNTFPVEDIQKIWEKEIKKRPLSQRIEQLQHNDPIELQTAIETETATG